MIGILLGNLAMTRSKNYKLKKCNYALITPNSHLTKVGLMTVIIGKTLQECDGEYENLEMKVKTNIEKFIRRMKQPEGVNVDPSIWLKQDSIVHVAICGIVGKSIDEVKYISNQIIRLTHQDIDTMKAAEALAVCVHMAKRSKIRLLHYMKEHYFPLDFNLEMIRKRQLGKVKHIDTVAYALEAHLEGTSFTNSLHFAMSLNHVSDDMLPLTAAIAARNQPLPEELKTRTLNKLQGEIREIAEVFDVAYPTRTWPKRYRQPLRVYGKLPMFRDPYYIGKKYLAHMKLSIPKIKKVKNLFDEYQIDTSALASTVRKTIPFDDYKTYVQVLTQASTFLQFFTFDITNHLEIQKFREGFHREDCHVPLTKVVKRLKSRDYNQLDIAEVKFSMFFRLRVMQWNSGLLEHFHYDITSLYLVNLYKYLLHYYTDDVLYEAVQAHTNLHSVNMVELLK